MPQSWRGLDIKPPFKMEGGHGLVTSYFVVITQLEHVAAPKHSRKYQSLSISKVLPPHKSLDLPV